MCRLVWLAILCMLGLQVLAQDDVDQASGTDQPLKVGVMVEPPFVMQDHDDSYKGLSVDLWKHLATELEASYEFVVYNDQLGLLRALDYQEIDLSINPFSVNGPRLQLFEATQPFFTSRIGIASAGSQIAAFQSFLGNIFSVNFLRLMVLLLALIFVFGLIIWIAEKRKNPHQFRGILDGFWWSVVTMTTVGYGDKAPKSVVGRTISVAWMFIAIILISSFTATIASTMTVSSLDARLERFEDIRNLGTVGTVDFTNSKIYLDVTGIPVSRHFRTPEAGLEALADGEIDFFVYDKYVMKYLITELELDGRTQLLSVTAGSQFLSFLLPKESPLLFDINYRIVDRIRTPTWQQILEKYHLQERE